MWPASWTFKAVLPRGCSVTHFLRSACERPARWERWPDKWSCAIDHWKEKDKQWRVKWDWSSDHVMWLSSGIAGPCRCVAAGSACVQRPRERQIGPFCKAFGCKLYLTLVHVHRNSLLVHSREQLTDPKQSVKWKRIVISDCFSRFQIEKKSVWLLKKLLVTGIWLVRVSGKLHFLPTLWHEKQF